MMKMTKSITLQAVRVHNHKNGLVTIEVPAAELPDADRETLDRLFPNLLDRVCQVLDQEAVLACVHTGPVPASPEGHSPDVIECHPYGSPLNPKAKPKFN